MVSERSSAKAAIKPDTPESVDPDLAWALSDGGQLRVSLEKERNRHTEAMAAGERGFIGRALGGTGNAPLAIGFLALTFGGIAWGWCLYMSQQDGADIEFWRTQADRTLAFAATALGFVFGRSTS